MLRIDAQHDFAPPAQGPEWYAKILARNRFAGSIYLPRGQPLEEALALAGQFPYIRRIVPTIRPEEVGDLPRHPLVCSVRLESVTRDALRELELRQLALEIPGALWPVAADTRIAVDGFPSTTDLPSHVYVKLTGFRLPAPPGHAELLRQFLRHPGPDRLMFASSWPHGGCTWKETLAAFTQALGPMPIEVREQLIGATACEFYGISM